MTAATAPGAARGRAREGASRRKDLRRALVDGVASPLNQVRADKGKLRVAITSLLRRSILVFRNLEEAANLFQGHYQQQLHPASPLVLTVSTCYKVIGGFLSYLQVPGESPGYFFNMSRILSIDKIGPDLDSFEARPGPFSISIIQRRPWRVFPTLVFAV